MADEEAVTAALSEPAKVPVVGADSKTGVAAAAQAGALIEVNGEKLTPAEVKRRFDLAAGAQKALQEMDGLKKNYSNFFAGLKSDPAGTIRLMLQQGVIDEKEAVNLATELYRDRVYNPAKLSKEELQARENERELKRLKAEQEQRDAEAKATKETQERNAAKQYIVGELTKAFKAHPEIPETADVIRFAAKHKNIANVNKTPITYDEAVVRAWTEIKGIMKKIAEQHNEDNILDYTGEELAEKINKAFLKKLKSKDKAAVVQKQADAPGTNPPAGMTRKQMREQHIKETIARIAGQSQGR
jgi:hypothetical protein